MATNESDARMLLETAREYAEAGRAAESRAVVADLVARFEHDADPEVRRNVCRALFGQAKHRLLEGVDRRAVIVDYRHILHIAERQPPIREVAAAAIYHLGLTHGKIAIERSNDEHREKSIERFIEVEQRFGGSRDPETAYWAMRAATSHAHALPLDAARALYERVIERYASDASAEVRAHAAAALEAWAERCATEGDPDLATSLRERARSLASSRAPT